MTGNGWRTLRTKAEDGGVCKFFSRAAREMASVERGREQPKWRTDGKELFYLVPDGKIMATPVTIGLNFDSGAPIALFQANPGEMVVTSEQFSYDVSGDGQKFL